MSGFGAIVVAGFGPGISSAVATKFGKQGYRVALLSRTQAKLDTAAADLAKEGVQAKGYATDLTNAAEVTSTLSKVSQDLGPVSILFWNPYGQNAGVLDGAPSAFDHAYQSTVTGLVAALQAVHKDLKANKGAVLVTGGGLSMEHDSATKMAVQWNAASLAVSKAAQRKLVHILHEQLAADDIYVAEVTVMGVVKGTPFDAQGNSTLTPESVADEFSSLVEKRDPSVWFVTKQ